MEYKVLWTVFTVVLLAELGDKTQSAKGSCTTSQGSDLLPSGSGRS